MSIVYKKLCYDSMPLHLSNRAFKGFRTTHHKLQDVENSSNKNNNKKVEISFFFPEKTQHVGFNAGRLQSIFFCIVAMHPLDEHSLS